MHRLGKTSEDLASLERADLIKARGRVKVFTMFSQSSDDSRFSTFMVGLPVLAARVMSPEDEPKYLNSAESETFNKRRMLFNFREAVPVARRLKLGHRC